MQFNESQVAQLRSDFAFWRAIEQAEGRPYPGNDEDTFKMLAVRSAEYGSLGGARSAWTRAAQELAAEGIIKLHKPALQPKPIPSDFEERVRCLTATELRVKLSKDKEFSDLFGRWSVGERPEGYIADQEPQLTASGWRGLPPNVAARKMRDPQFRAQVQRLIDRGLI